MTTDLVTRRPAPVTATTPTAQRALTTAVLTVASFVVLMPSPAAAQELGLTARLVEWNCPVTGGDVVNPQNPTPPDPFPGAIIADGGFVYWVTTTLPQLFRLTPGANLESDDARCNRWELDPDTPSTGGLRLRPASNDIYIRSIGDLQRVNTVTNQRTKYVDGLLTFSDLSVFVNGSTSVYTTGIGGDGNVLQRLRPTVAFACPPEVVDPAATPCVRADRYLVGGGAGEIFLSGVDTHPLNGSVVFYSEPFTNQIGRLTIASNGTATVRRWSLGELGPACDPFDPSLAFGPCQPRQIDVHTDGMVYGVTGSGHLFRLDPLSNTLLVAPIPTLGVAGPGNPTNNPIGVDANGFVGFTAAGQNIGFNKVGTWFPDGIPTPVTFTDAPAPLTTVGVPGETVLAGQFTTFTPPVVKTALATEADTIGGTIWEAAIDTALPVDTSDCTGTPDDADGLSTDPCSPSTQPRGVSSDPRGGPGDYFAAIGFTVNRIAHVSIPVQTVGSVSGGGWIETTQTTTNPLTGVTTTTTTQKGSFGLVAMRKRDGDPVKGHVTYVDHLDNDKVISLELTDLTVSGNDAIIGGLCQQNVSSCLTFRVDVEDNGQPHGSVSDSFAIVQDPLFGLGTPEGGPLRGGNLKVYAR